MNKQKFSIIKIIFVLAITLMIILAVFSFIRTNNLIKSSEWVNHSTLIKLNLSNTYAGVTTMESYQRGYIITRDSVFLQKYSFTKDNLNKSIKAIDSLTFDNKAQRQNLVELKKMVYKRIGYLENILSDTNITAITNEKMLRGKMLMDDIQAHITYMTQEEDRLLQIRTRKLDREIFFSPLITILLFLCAIFFILIAYFKIIHDLSEAKALKREIENTNQLLALKNEELRDTGERYLKIFDNNPVALTLSEIGSNIITYANEKFFRNFGYSEDEVLGFTTEELNIVSKEENERLIPIILSFLEEDRSIEELQQLPPEETEQLLLKLRLKMFKDGFEVKYTKKSGENFYALVYFEVIEIAGTKYTITSYQDITERKKAIALVELQNEELVKMNKELESFNYISSHDLQEPLRKIQIFSNRIMETENEKLSDTGKEYFNRIQSSALRMQNLIKDLLAYSRVTADEKQFTVTDLSKIVEQVVAELRDTIDEKQAFIEVGPLDKIPLIPFQFHQLITNLLSNALKFTKEGVRPHISIHSSVRKGSKSDHSGLNAETRYCHITVSDNGIGFEEEYSQYIFEVFRQLNVRGKYEGSGIGLSIVKKIVDNHNGYITAGGKLNEGARFDIYIPV